MSTKRQGEGNESHPMAMRRISKEEIYAYKE